MILLPPQGKIINDDYTSKQQNAEALNSLLSAIEISSHGTARDAGTKFETLIRDWLVNETTYKDRFSYVQKWKEWDKNHPEKTTNAKDTGIDLVGTLSDGSGFAAIQCKFYAKDDIVPKAGIDSFLATADARRFKERFLIATNDHWTDNAQETLRRAFPPVTLIKRSDLAASLVNWNLYSKGKVALRERRTPRPYQKEAIQAVINGFKTADRGKLIMACGTGKTYTSLKISEAMVGKGGLVMFLVPSLSLLSQTLTDWKQQCLFPIHAFAVCSDTKTGKADAEDIDDLTTASELVIPATTEADTLANGVHEALKKKDGMTVIFSTYHSMDVIHDAQRYKTPLPVIDLVVCDEAHRTSGGFFKDEQEKPFTRIHNNDFIRAAKRLYMTATPKIYGPKVKEQQSSGDIELYSMDDEAVYGKTFHEISFTQAVQQYQCLVDYKVIVLTVNEDLVKDAYIYADVKEGGLSVSNAAKVVGCWRALSKMDLKEEISMGDDKEPMRRAVGFAQVIHPSDNYDRTSSIAFAKRFDDIITDFKKSEKERLKKLGEFNEERFDIKNRLACETRHIDGSMNAVEKTELLDWLRAEPKKDTCKILFNVRCLSEGVDVPALDAVLFLSPRKSMVDVVQTVGRVMRRAPGKKRGYVIIPIVTPSGVAPDLVLDRNKDFDTVWQVLRALKSIDSNFGAIVDGQLGKIDDSKMEVICLSDNEVTKRGKRKPKDTDGPVNRRGSKTGGSGNKTREQQKKDAEKAQLSFDFGRNEIMENELKARIVKKVGNRREWEDWAEDVGGICREQIKHIQKVLATSPESMKAFERFRTELKQTLNGELSDDEIVEMLGQHVVTKPILDALFADYPFTEKNPIARAMTAMVEKLDKEGLTKANHLLDGFYKSVQIRMRNVKTAAERQTVIKELFEKFFKFAFPKQQEKLGIVYTPVEIVDFINQSVADVLKNEFHTSIDDEGIHILDPFTGTGTFIARLMQSGLITKDKLPAKFKNDLHANEIMPLAYYVASMNLESVFYELCPPTDATQYEPNRVTIWTDTFADHTKKDLFTTSLAENNARLKEVMDTDIRVIIGNPPYSVGQDNANDDNQNEHYEKLDQRLAETYVKESTAALKSSLYDSYVRAYRWASDRIGERGVIGFVTNAGWLDSNSADGMRKCMAEEFSSIYIWHLKGNQRTVGEQSKKEGGKVFGQGSRAPVAVVILVKNPEHKRACEINFAAVGDYLTREEKLKQTAKAKGICGLTFQRITPDAHGDWLNQRDDSFSKFYYIGDSKCNKTSIFSIVSWGAKSNRDIWTVGACSKEVFANIKRFHQTFDMALDLTKERIPQNEVLERCRNNISWSRSVLKMLASGSKLNKINADNVVSCIYRPFFAQKMYYEQRGGVFEEPGKWAKILPANNKNIVICTTGIGAKEFSCLICNHIADIQTLFNGQCFPRYFYEKSIKKVSAHDQTTGELFADQPSAATPTLDMTVDNYERRDAITPEALQHFREVYPGATITADDLFYYIYGILHSEDYRRRYANNLMKELPRIPRVATYGEFQKFAEAGRKLADLHLNFEKVPEYKGVQINEDRRDGFSYYVTQMKHGKIPGKTGNAAKDKTKLVYNEFISVEGIPLEAQEYVVNKKSALDWIVERACVKTDKDSGIVNDFNDYAAEKKDPRYPLSLFLRIITVSLETMKIVKSLPPLQIHPADM